MYNNDRRLIEDLIPIREISAEAAREKSLRYGNISTLHLWWARRPIVAARAAVYGALVPTPDDAGERETYMARMRKLCSWDIPNGVLEQARKDILEANGGQPPRMLDMFAGGGSIPLEALRLGCEAYAVELNPVAHIIELCTLVYPQKYGPSLVADVKKWGEWVIERAKAQLAEFYPAPQSEQQMSDDIVQSTFAGEQKHTQLNGALTPIAYLWTRTVPCPNPTCGATVPLVRQTWLKKKEANYVALHIVPDHATKKVRFEQVQAATLQGLGFDPEAGSKKGNATCPFCGAIASVDYIKEQGQKKQIGYQMMAVVATKSEGSGKVYLSVTNAQFCAPDEVKVEERINQVCAKMGLSVPDEPLPVQGTLGFRIQAYGMVKWKDLFTSRQILALLTFVAQVHDAHTAMLEEGIEFERATVITTYLGMMVDRLAENLSTLCRWNAVGSKLQGTFGRQALPMIWDFAETNPFGGSVGDAESILFNISNILGYLTSISNISVLLRATATSLPITDNSIDALVTDPPYYDNVPYVVM